MEEYCGEIRQEVHNCQNAIDNQVNQIRHVSMVYGVQFQSKVALFQRTHSSNIVELASLSSLPKQNIFKKVYQLLKSLVSDPSKHQQIFKSFQIMQNEMSLEVRRSKQCISSRSSAFSQNDVKENNSDSGSDSSEHTDILKQMSNSSGNGSLEGRASLKLVKARTSMMSKTNRISIADTMSVSQMQAAIKNMSPLQAINSTDSLQSIESQPLKSYRTRKAMDLQSLGSVSEQLQETKIPCKQIKKISIMMMDENDGNQSELFSQEQILSLNELAPPSLPFTQKTVQIIFDSPEPFLINLSLCLLIKCLAKGMVKITEANAGWLLSIATVVSYKIFYDEPVGGLLQCFAQILGVSMSGVVGLERWFLQSLNYELVVSNREYQQMMFMLLRQPQ